MVTIILRWSARILMILAILFMMMFSFDVFEMESSFGEKMLGLLMHNIPALILTALLILAWKKELAGGILLLIASFVMMFYFHSFTNKPSSLIVIMPFLLAGILFIVSYLTGINEKKRIKD